jgi:dTDP-4-dehydrorhamnose reductase
MTREMSVLVLGGTGHIGYETTRALATRATVIAPTRGDVDLTNAAAIRELVRDAKPAVVINAAAYTAVDAAESDADACERLNAELPAILGEECARLDALLVHFSSDYVFDGTKRSPYLETDAANPLSVYGRSKLAGDRAIEASNAAHLIVRTSWVYSARGRNFPLTMLRLARERAELRVVNDQTGAPTAAPAIAQAVARVLDSLWRAADFTAASESASGVYHMTAGGSTTWYEFAKTILASDPRAHEQVCAAILPIATTEYPTPALRPAYSVLDNAKLAAHFGVRLPSWLDQWQAVVATMQGRGG